MSNSSCVEKGGCPADYVVAGISGLTCVLICISAGFVIIKRRTFQRNFNKKISLLLVQAAASLMFLLGALMSKDIFRLNPKHFWAKCHLWQVWLEGPFGFGLLFCCFIAQIYRLYYVFHSRRLQPLAYYQLLFVLLFPWFLVAAVLQSRPHVFNDETCSYKGPCWKIVIGCLHGLYPILFLCGAWNIRSIRFQFNEFNELLQGVIVCSVLLVTLSILFVVAQIKHDKSVISRFIYIIAVNASVIILYWIPISKPVTELIKGRKEKFRDFSTMGQALGVPYSGFVPATSLAFDFNKPLDCLLEHKQFRHSYLEFADSRMAGEVVHFYVEVRELNKIPADNPVQRVYLAEHIIDKYIKTGSAMEINISHQMRSEILNTRDLADPDLFKRAVNETLRMMQTNLTNDYWKSTAFEDLKAELEADAHYSDGLEPMDASMAPDNPFDPPKPASSSNV